MEYYGDSQGDKSAKELNPWEFPSAERYSTGTTCESTIISGGLYRTVSDTGLDYSRSETPVEANSLRTGLQFQLNTIRPSKQFVSSASRLIAEMTSVVTTYLDASASVVPYGSIASNLCVDNASVDLMVFIPPNIFDASFGCTSRPGQHADIPIGMLKEYDLRQSMRKALARLGELFTVFCGFYLVKLTNVAPVSSICVSSRVPVLTMVDPVSGLSFEITCNNVFPLFSTRLLKAYNSLVPTGELRDCVLLVKHWASRRGLVGAGPGCLSGFAWTVMCVFYCQSGLGLLPSLQSMSCERQQWTDPFGSNRRCDVGFEADCDPVALTGGLDGVALFVGFVDYFANYWNWKNAVVSVRLGRVVHMESAEVFIKPPAVERAPALIIEDPFDIKRDLCGQGSFDRLRSEFVESALLIAAGGTVSSLLMPTGQSVAVAPRKKRAESAI